MNAVNVEVFRTALIGGIDDDVARDICRAACIEPDADEDDDPRVDPICARLLDDVVKALWQWTEIKPEVDAQHGPFSGLIRGSEQRRQLEDVRKAADTLSAALRACSEPTRVRLADVGIRQLAYLCGFTPDGVTLVSAIDDALASINDPGGPPTKNAEKMLVWRLAEIHYRYMVFAFLTRSDAPFRWGDDDDPLAQPLSDDAAKAEWCKRVRADRKGFINRCLGAVDPPVNIRDDTSLTAYDRNFESTSGHPSNQLPPDLDDWRMLLPPDLDD